MLVFGVQVCRLHARDFHFSDADFQPLLSLMDSVGCSYYQDQGVDR